MEWALELIEAPDVEPVTLAELKSQAHITYTAQDSTLTSYLLAARTIAEEYQRRSYISQTWELTLDRLPCLPMRLFRGKVQSLVSITLYDVNNDAHVLDISDFILDNDVLNINYGVTWDGYLLRDTAAVKIRYVAGYGDTAADVPANVKHAIILFASFSDDNRAADTVNLPKSFWDLLRPGRIHLTDVR